MHVHNWNYSTRAKFAEQPSYGHHTCEHEALIRLSDGGSHKNKVNKGSQLAMSTTCMKVTVTINDFTTKKNPVNL